MLEHHNDHRDVKGIRPERQSVPITQDTFKPTLGPGDLEHLARRIEGDDGTRGAQQACEPTRPGSEVQDPFPGTDAADLDNASEPKLAVGSLVSSNPIVVRGSPRIVDRHASCKRRVACQATGPGVRGSRRSESMPSGKALASGRKASVAGGQT